MSVEPRPKQPIQKSDCLLKGSKDLQARKEGSPSWIDHHLIRALNRRPVDKALCPCIDRLINLCPKVVYRNEIRVSAYPLIVAERVFLDRPSFLSKKAPLDPEGTDFPFSVTVDDSANESF